MRRGGLGRGLAALIPGAEESVPEAGTGKLVELAVSEIRPNPQQPRKSFPRESLEALADSIREVGLLQPVVVRRAGFGYELVAGERRVRAARVAGLTAVPAIVRDAEESRNTLREALIENIHREELGPLELASAFQELLDDLGGTQEEVAARLGCSRAHVANTIRLLSLPPDVQRLVAERRLQAGHARALLALPDDEARSALALRAVAEGLSVRAVEAIVRRYADPARPAPAPARGAVTARSPSAVELEDRLVERLGTRVRVTMGKKRGRIVIEVGSPEELERVSALLARDVDDPQLPATVTLADDPATVGV